MVYKINNMKDIIEMVRMQNIQLENLLVELKGIKRFQEHTITHLEKITNVTFRPDGIKTELKPNADEAMEDDETCAECGTARRDYSSYCKVCWDSKQNN